MNVFSYIVASDSGFAPNPFWGFCTLSCCKPAIRRTAHKGDLIIGLTPKASGNRIVYIMRVTDKMSFAEYWHDHRFLRKRPHLHKNERTAAGDNIYRPVTGGEFQQQLSRHSNEDGSEDQETKVSDLRGEFVLISDDFVYYGAEAIELPSKFRRLIVGRGHRSLSQEASLARASRLIAEFDKFFCDLPKGRIGLPTMWAGGAARHRRKPMKRHCKQQAGSGK